MPFVAAAKDAMLNSLVMDAIRLHSGVPGAAGSDFALGDGLSAATFGSSASGSRSLSPAVTVAGLAANQSVTHFSVWTTAGSVFRGSGSITSGDVTANGAGSFTLATGTTLTLSDS